MTWPANAGHDWRKSTGEAASIAERHAVEFSSIARRRAPSQGFTLIEVLIALTILSISLAVLLAIFTEGLDRAREDENEAAARAMAQSLLVQTEAAANPAIGDSSGYSAGMSWRVRVMPYGSSDDAAAWQEGAAQILATVYWRGLGGRRSVSLTGLRLLPKAQQE